MALRSVRATIVHAVAALFALAFVSSVPAYGVTEVYMIPHSHCDAGWLLTAQGYFDTWPKMPPNHTGSGGSVHSILDSVTAQLAANPSYRFVWAETIWLEKWWPLQNASTRATFQQLVDEQRIEFVGGGYVQNDETMVTHQDVVDQTTVGHEFLRREFNATVHHGWQIDMFSGYSSVTPSLWALSGYEAMLLRYEGNATMRATWEADKAFEFVWQASNSLTAAESSIFAHVVNGNYGDLTGACYPLGFNFECGNPGDCKNNPPVTDGNLANRSACLVDWLKSRAAHYQGPYLILYGSDFHWHHADYMFGNMTQIIDYINSHEAEFQMHVRYATYAEYLDALHATNLTFPRVQWPLDFELGWPHHLGQYNKSALTYQTGTHTSWATYKQLVRHADAQASVAETAAAAVTSAASGARPPFIGDGLGIIRRARALVQHHDSVPGTMRTNVSCDESFYIGNADVKADYEDHLHAACAAAASIAAQSVTQLSCGAGAPAPGKLEVLNATTRIRGVAGASYTVAVYNALGWTRNEVVFVPLDLATPVPKVTVTDGETGVEVPAQYHQDPLTDAADAVVFVLPATAAVPPLGFRTYGIDFSPRPSMRGGAMASEPADRGVRQSQLPSRVERVHAHAVSSGCGGALGSAGVEDGAGHGAGSYRDGLAGAVGDPNPTETITNGIVSATFSSITGWLVSMNNSRSGVSVPVRQDLANYINGTGGAYILFEQGPAELVAEPVKTYEIRGDVYHEWCQVFDPAQSNANAICFRVYNAPATDASRAAPMPGDDLGFVEVVHDVGPIALKREVVSRFSTDIDADSTLWTDDSGLEMHRRALNASAGIPANYHALVYSAFIRGVSASASDAPGASTKAQLTAMTAHTTGVASLQNGQLEVMLLRRLNASDSQGPWPLDDGGRIVAPLWLTLDDVEGAEGARQALIERLNKPVAVMAAAVPMSAWKASGCKTHFAGASRDLPPNVALMSLMLRQWDAPAAFNASTAADAIDAVAAGGGIGSSGVEQIVARVRHMFERGAHPVLSQPADVDIAATLAPVIPALTAPQRVSLTLQYDYATHTRRQWPVRGQERGQGLAQGHWQGQGHDRTNSVALTAPSPGIGDAAGSPQDGAQSLAPAAASAASDVGGANTQLGPLEFGSFLAGY